MTESPLDDAPAEDLAAPSMRQRAKTRWPGVLLTLTSIIQALALETLWSEMSEEPFGAMSTFEIWVVGLQGLSVLLMVVVLWLFYAQLVMRFDWVPGLQDSMAPFVLGIIEFALAETIGMESVGFWIAAFAVPVMIAHAVTLSIFARARHEPGNAAFFANLKFATIVGWRRHAPQVGTAVLSLALGGVVIATDGAPAATLASLTVLCVLLAVQLSLQRLYWTLSIQD